MRRGGVLEVVPRTMYWAARNEGRDILKKKKGREEKRSSSIVGVKKKTRTINRIPKTS